MKTKLIAGFIVVAGFALLAGTPQVPGAIFTTWITGSASAPYNAVAGYTQWALVGTTTTTHMGDAGVRGMNDACRAEFPMSRMCSSVEVIETVPHYAFSSSDPAWVRPIFQPISAGASDGTTVLDSSGLIAEQPSNLACYGWATANPGTSGQVVSPDGSFSWAGCSVARPIACCALIQVPEPSQNSGLAMGIAALGLLNRRRRHQ